MPIIPDADLRPGACTSCGNHDASICLDCCTDNAHPDIIAAALAAEFGGTATDFADAARNIADALGWSEAA